MDGKVSSPVGRVSCNRTNFKSVKDDAVSSPVGRVSCNILMMVIFATSLVSSPVGRVSCNHSHSCLLTADKCFVPCGACELQFTDD